MNEKIRINAVTREISNYRGLIVSHRFLCVVLLAAQIFLIVKGTRSFTAFIILFSHLAFPLVLGEITASKAKKNTKDESELPLPLLRKRLGCTKARSDTYSYSFLFSVILLIVWSGASRSSEYELIRALPNPILGSFAAVRLFIWLFYRFMFRFFPERIIK